jgi:electron transfer flavoprotein beta subunit
MQIYVCVKHVPDTAANIKIVGDNGFDDGGCKFIANPYDEYAIEQAVQLVEKNGGEVIVVTVGKAAAAATIRAAMAMGAHRGILVTVDSQFLDSQTTAQALKAAIDKDGTTGPYSCRQGCRGFRRLSDPLPPGRRHGPAGGQ